MYYQIHFVFLAKTATVQDAKFLILIYVHLVSMAYISPKMELVRLVNLVVQLVVIHPIVLLALQITLLSLSLFQLLFNVLHANPHAQNVYLVLLFVPNVYLVILLLVGNVLLISISVSQLLWMSPWLHSILIIKDF